jgi:Rieske Fe-S protein
MDSTAPSPTGDNDVNAGRRRFLFILPLSIIAGISATIATAAFRFLRPVVSGSAAKWIDVATLSDLQGEKPVLKRITAEEQSGWSTSVDEHFVYVLPSRNNTVLSCVCPHEGCSVAWNETANGFLCPCHDSLFGPDGARIKGPARRGLDPLPTREQDGKLQVQYLSFVNNTEQREVLE